MLSTLSMSPPPAPPGDSPGQLLFGPNRSVTERFGGLTGVKLQSAIFEAYVVSTASIPWFNSNGDKNFVRHAVNPRRQDATVDAYVSKILEGGVVEGVRGECWVVSPATEGQPFRCISWGTLSAAQRSKHEDEKRGAGWKTFVSSVSKGSFRRQDQLMTLRQKKQHTKTHT